MTQQKVPQKSGPRGKQTRRVAMVEGVPFLDFERTITLKTINDIIKWPISAPFRQPVDPNGDDAKGYLQVVSKPMDLGTIKSNLETGEYQTVEEFKADLHLMVTNAEAFNGAESIIARAAMDVEQAILKQLEHRGDDIYQDWDVRFTKLVAKLRAHVGLLPGLLEEEGRRPPERRPEGDLAVS